MLESSEMQGIPSHDSPCQAGLVAILGAIFPLLVVKLFGLSFDFLLPLEVFSIWICAFPALNYVARKDFKRLAFCPHLVKGLVISTLFLIGILGINYLF